MREKHAPIVHDVEAGSCAVAVGDVELRAPHVGSGLVVCVFDGRDVGGVAHVLASGTEQPGYALQRPGLYVGTAVPALLGLMRGSGARRDLTAVLVGGAVGRLPPNGPTWATKTLAFARNVLRDLGVPVVDEFTGGPHVRGVAFSGRGLVRVCTCGQWSSVSMARPREFAISA